VSRRSPHRAHWQPLAYNALHGGMQRWFEPVLPPPVDAAGLARAADSGWPQVADALRGPQALVCRGAPVPHRHHRRHRSPDAGGRPPRWRGFVAVFLVGRQRVKGGETRVFDAAGPGGVRFTLASPGRCCCSTTPG
jgi:hypothetical protein